MHAANPFHEGELKAQQLSGEAEMGESNGAMIGDTIMSGALNFIRAQEMVVVSSRDDAGRRWASLLFGKKGFLQPNGASELRIALDPSRTDGEDPLWKNLESDPRAGLLVIDLETRRRLRINGEIERRGIAAAAKEVDRAHGSFVHGHGTSQARGGCFASGRQAGVRRGVG